jgi:CRP-like cAMP-binding protein
VLKIRRERYERDQILFEQGQPCSRVHQVVIGAVLTGHGPAGYRPPVLLATMDGLRRSQHHAMNLARRSARERMAAFMLELTSAPMARRCSTCP